MTRLLALAVAAAVAAVSAPAHADHLCVGTAHRPLCVPDSVEHDRVVGCLVTVYYEDRSYPVCV